MKKRVYLLLTIAVLAAVGVTIFLIAYNHSAFSKVRAFDVDDYQELIGTFPSKECLGKISGKTVSYLI